MSKSFTMYAVATRGVDGIWYPHLDTFSGSREGSEIRFEKEYRGNAPLGSSRNTKIVRFYVSTTPPGRKS